MLITALRFGAVSPLLLDHRGELVARLSKRYDLTEWNSPSDSLVQLYTKDARRLFQVSIRDLFFSTENFDELEEEEDWASSIMSETLEMLGVEEIVWMGTRMHWLSATDSFSDLCKWFMERFGIVAPAVKVLDREPSDVGVVLEFKDKNPLITLRFGPMRARQAMDQFFRDKDPTHYPDDFLFVDIDRVQPDERLKAKDALSKWKERVDNLASQGAQIATAIASA